MPQYDVVPNPDPATAGRAPYLIVLQHDLLQDLPTVVVAPVVRDAPAGLDRLLPEIEVAGEMLRVSTVELFATRHNRLGPPVANVSRAHDRVLSAVDLIFSGI